MGFLVFTTQFLRGLWCSFDRPLKDERLSRPWSHPVVLNPGPLDRESRESNAVTNGPLLHMRGC